MADTDDPAGRVTARHARETLARELHDELTHRLARVSLQVMAHRDVEDADRLRTAVEVIARPRRTCGARLWLLDRVLRACCQDGEPVPAEPPADLRCLEVCPVAGGLGLLGRAPVD